MKFLNPLNETVNCAQQWWWSRLEKKNLKIKKGVDETGIIHETINVPFVSGYDEGGPWNDWFSLWSDVEETKKKWISIVRV